MLRVSRTLAERDPAQEYEDCKCVVEEHPQNYRSVHYLLESAPTKEKVIVELQVRTIFEEAWSEIDHRVNYPSPMPEAIVGHYLSIFNRLTGNADEMASFLPALVERLRAKESESLALQAERDDALAEVEGLIGKLEVSEEGRTKLRDQLKRLKNADDRLSGGVIFKDTVDAVVGGHINIAPRSCSRCGKPIADWGIGKALQDDLCEMCRLTSVSIVGSVMKTCGSCGSWFSDDSSGLTLGSDKCPSCRGGLTL